MIKFATALVSEDVIGSYIRGRYNGKKETEELREMADEAGIPCEKTMEDENTG